MTPAASTPASATAAACFVAFASDAASRTAVASGPVAGGVGSHVPMQPESAAKAIVRTTREGIGVLRSINLHDASGEDLVLRVRRADDCGRHCRLRESEEPRIAHRRLARRLGLARRRLPLE